MEFLESELHGSGRRDAGGFDREAVTRNRVCVVGVQ